MHKFSMRFEKGEDPNTDMPAFGFVDPIQGGFIVHPRMSRCSRFEVDPVTAYGITEQDADELIKLNELVCSATEDALNAGCLAIQVALGIPSGDVAGLHFSGVEQRKPIAQAFLDYIGSEMNYDKD